MKKTFREFHLFKLLELLESDSAPLDGLLSQYFRKNKAIGSKDRKEIAETIYQMVRWQGLIDHFCEETHSWEERFRVFKAQNLKKKIHDEKIPLHVRMSFPKAFYDKIHSYYGEERAKAICLASNTKAPVTLRVNVLKTNRQTLYAKWKDQYDISLTKDSVFGINVAERLNFHTLEEFKLGHFEVQDEASQLVAGLVDAKPGQLVLDYCAGSGGKTLGFAHKLQEKGQIYLHDIRKKALENAKKRLRRAGIENAQVIEHDSPNLKSLYGKMDWVLVDAPCSGSGTLRRNPDLKWKFSDEMLKRVAEEQREIFKNALPFLKKGGHIVYATCSLLPQENEEQVDYFQKEHGLELIGRPFRTLPTEGGMDGFFAAVLR